MAKAVSPFGAKRVSGRIGDGFVMASWRGIPYIRQFVVPAHRSSKRLDHIRGLFALQNRRWMYLQEAEREAWRVFCEKKRLVGLPHVVFASYSRLALDAGFPEPLLPPRSKAPQSPKLRIQLEGEGLIISWSFPRLTSHLSLLTGLVDLWFWSGFASHNPHPHFFKHLAYLPVSAGKFLFQSLKPRRTPNPQSLTPAFKYSFRARLVLPDSNHGLFSEASLIPGG
jgi:hypothetical protein